VEDLPLVDGTNILTLIATDAANNSSVTNFTVVKSSVVLTIDDVPEYQLNQETVIVTGTINVSDHTVWVNGVRATLDGGAWSAENVPLPRGGKVVIQARAIPDTDNGGNGTGTGGSPNFQNPGNPASPNATDAESQKNKPPFLYASNYTLDCINEILVACVPVPCDYPKRYETTLYWCIGEGAKQTARADFDSFSNCEIPHTQCITTWPADWSWPPVKTGTCDCGYDKVPPPHIPFESCKVNLQTIPAGYSWGNTCFWGTLTRSAQTELKLFTGGIAAYKHRNLFVISGCGMKGGEALDWPTTIIPFEEITIGELGRLGSDGKLYVALPDNETKVVTPSAAKQYYTFDVQAQKYKLVLMFLNRKMTENGMGWKVIDPLYPNIVARLGHLVGDTIRFGRNWDPYLDPDFSDEEYVWSGVRSGTGKTIEVVFNTASELSETLTVKSVTRTAVAKVMDIPPPNQDEWASAHPWAAALVWSASREASDWAENLCQHQVKAWNCRADAVRHAYWTALMIKCYGLSAQNALGASTAHERTNVERGGNHNEVVMDMENNLIGIALAAKLPRGAGRTDIQNAVRAAADSGSLTVLDEISNRAERGLLVPSSFQDY